MTQGYIIPLWSDLIISVFYAVSLVDETGELIGNIDYHGDENELIGEVIEGRTVTSVKRETELTLQMGFPTDTMNAPDGTEQSNLGQHTWDQVGDACPLKNYRFGKDLVKLINPWAIETEAGWSCLFKAPAGILTAN